MRLDRLAKILECRRPLIAFAVPSQLLYGGYRLSAAARLRGPGTGDFTDDVLLIYFLFLSRMEGGDLSDLIRLGTRLEEL